MLAGQIESLTKNYWRCQRWKTSARMSEGEDRSSALHNDRSSALHNEERI